VTERNNYLYGEAGAGASATTSMGLLEGAKHHEPEAWRRLTRLYGPLLYHWCRRAGLQPPDAEDIVQEVFLTVANKITTFARAQPGGTFRGWLRGILRNKIGDWLRRRKGREQELDGAEAERYLCATPEREAEEAADAAALGSLYRRALALIRAEFEERTWLAFWRVVVEGQSATDVAAGLEMTRNAVYLAKSRILRRFHEVLGDACDAV
jgi:RNA polymerase sigma-70 factor (ECF subfamily)